MYYHLYVYKEDFDFINGELPDQLHFYFGDQLDRARDVLKNRSLVEIHYALDSLDWILRQGSNVHREVAFKKADIKGYAFTHRVKALKDYANVVDISGQSQLPNATWADYFAVLTLAYVAETLCEENYRHESFPSPTNEAEHPFHIDWAVESMEAVCYAEQLQALDALRKELALPDTTEVMQQRGQKGGLIRSQRFSELKDKVIKLYKEKYTARSNRDAAKRIEKDLSQEDLAVLTSAEPWETFTRWIAQYKRDNP
jgi:hypothetical protein